VPISSRIDQAGLSTAAIRRSFNIAANSTTKNPPITHGTANMAVWLPANSWTKKVPATDAIGRQTPETPET
jgi:hypothetical protein